MVFLKARLKIGGSVIFGGSSNKSPVFSQNQSKILNNNKNLRDVSGVRVSVFRGVGTI